MKKSLFFLGALMASCISALAMPLPNSMEVTVGDLLLRLDGKKRCNMNSVLYQGERIGVDDRGFHYGTVLFVKGEKGFVGSGHTDAGYGEEVDRLELRVDGVLVDAKEGAKFHCRKSFQMRKLSHIGHFQVDYTLDVMDNRIYQSVWISSDAELEMTTIYPLIQPWDIRFTSYLARKSDGSVLRGKFAGKGAIPITTAGIETIACYDETSGLGVVTEDLGGVGQGKPTRTLWDRHVYRKDYLADYSNMVFPKDHQAHYTAQTAFFTERDASKWEAAAENALKPAK